MTCRSEDSAASKFLSNWSRDSAYWINDYIWTNSATYATNASLKGIVFSGFRVGSVDAAAAISAIFNYQDKQHQM